MDALPSNIMFDIFSRIPVKCLARLRCVSKLWCEYIDDPYLGIIHGKRSEAEEPTFIMFHSNTSRTLCFHVIESVDTLLLKPKKKPDLGFVGKKLISPTPERVTRVQFRGSCNGLFVISQDDCQVVTEISVIHPLKKQCYKLPDLPFESRLPSFLIRESFGLGFDASTNTLKMVCSFFKHKKVSSSRYPADLVKKNLCTMVHEFGTNSWREIPGVPFYPIHGASIFSSDGCLYWLASPMDSKREDGGRHVIWFDVRKEEFGVIDPPSDIGYPHMRRYSMAYDHLVDLNGQLAYVCNSKVWVLISNKKDKDKDKDKEWMLHFCINHDLPDGYIKVLGYRNNDGDVLIKVTKPAVGWDLFYVYGLKSGVLHEAEITGITRRDDEYITGIVMYPNTMLSIQQGINTNTVFQKKEKNGREKKRREKKRGIISFLSKSFRFGRKIR